MNRWTTLSTDASLHLHSKRTLAGLVIASCRVQLPEEPSQPRPRLLPGRSTEVGEDIRSQSVPYPVAQAGQHSPTGNVQEADVLGRQAAVVLPGAPHSTEEVAKAVHDIKLTAYNDTTIPCCWTGSCPSKFQQSVWEDTEFHIVDVQGPAVIRLPSSESLKIVTVHCSVTTNPDQGTTNKLVPITSIQDLMRTYPDQFNRIPEKAKLVVDPNVPTRIDPPSPPPLPSSKTPIALKDSMKWELDKMQDSGVIRRVTESTDWVSSLAYSHKKEGDLRVCLDPMHPNKALKRPHHNTPNTHTEHPQSKN